MKKITRAKAKFLLFLCVLLTTTISFGLAFADIGNDIVSIADKYDQKKQPDLFYSQQCKGFVRAVYMEALGVELPGTNDNNSEWDNYQKNGFTLVAEFLPEEVFRNRDSSQYTKEYFFNQFTSYLSKGDAIQIDGESLPHTMIYVSTDTTNGKPSGLRVIESNYVADHWVSYRNVSFDDLWNYMGGASSNGMRAYRYTGR